MRSSRPVLLVSTHLLSLADICFAQQQAPATREVILLLHSSFYLLLATDNAFYPVADTCHSVACICAA